MRDDLRGIEAGMRRIIRRRAVWRPRDGNHPAIVGRARRWARRTLPRLLTRPARVDLVGDLDLVISELVTNAVRHGGGCTRVELRATGRTLRLSVNDDRATPPVVPPVAPPAARPLRESGRGMLLVETIAARWGVHRIRHHGGKAVWLDLSLT